MSWLDETIFVTGATGFIGGRVCERLFQAGARRIRALVHSMPHAARIGRIPVELCAGDLLDRNSLRSAMGDATVIIHCGLGRGRAIVKGTENLLSIAHQNKLKRFVHMSTAAVYGLTPPAGSVAEDAPLRRTGNSYCDNKARAEQVVAKFARRGVPVVILRPSIVYGPYSAWSTRLILDLRAGEAGLIDKGKGACNTTYVDNLVDAIFQCVEKDEARGQKFFITDGEPITWGDFIRAHVAMLAEEVDLSEADKQETLACYKQRPGVFTGSAKAVGEILRSRELRQLLLRIPIAERTFSALWGHLASLPDDQQRRIRGRVGIRPKALTTPIRRYIPDEVTLATQTGSVFFSIEKARRVLGYSPRITFAQGIARVEQWLRFANYL